MDKALCSGELTRDEIMRRIASAARIMESMGPKHYAILLSKESWEMIGKPASISGHEVMVDCDFPMGVISIREKDPLRGMRGRRKQESDKRR